MLEFPGASALTTLQTPHMRLGVLCDHALVGQDGKLSLIGIFDRIAVPGLPVQHPRFFVVAVFDMAPGDYVVRVELLDPTGSNVLQDQGVEIPVGVVAPGQSGNLVAELNMLPLEFAGRYDFNLYVEADRIGAISLTVDVGQPQFMPGGPEMGQA
jgi:hypothetical protein